MTKHATSLFYFTLEANENICFYSTLPFEKGTAMRDVVVYYTPELKSYFDTIITGMENLISIEILEDEVLIDDL
jgi:hypothetical protein